MAVNGELSLPSFDEVMGADNELEVDEDEEMDYTLLCDMDASRDDTVRDESLSECGNHVKQSILGKRAAYYRKYLTVPRVLKRDIRRQFPKMIANILNNPDFNYFHEFFRHFSVGLKDIRLKVRDTHGVPFQTHDQFSHLFRRDLPETFAYQGYAWIFFHWYLMTALNPDQVVRIEEAKIHTRSDTSKSKVALDVSVDFHRMYDIHITRFMGSILGAMVNEMGMPLKSPPAHELVTIPHEQAILEQSGMTASDAAVLSASVLRSIPSAVMSSPSAAMDECFSSQEEEPTVGYPFDQMPNPPDPFAFYVRKAGKHMPLLPEPQAVVLRMRLTFHLNENKRIEMLETSNLRVQ